MVLIQLQHFDFTLHSHAYVVTQHQLYKFVAVDQHHFHVRATPDELAGISIEAARSNEDTFRNADLSTLR